MNCYNHPNTSAVGICKNCNKGLCRECVTEIDNGLACTATCIEEVKLLNSLINRTKTSYKTAADTHYKNALMYVGFGIVFIIFGVTTERLTGFLSLIGVLFLIGAILSVVSANKYKKER